MGFNEGWSLGDSISDSSEELLQRDNEEVSRYVVLVQREYVQSSTHVDRKLLLPQGTDVSVNDSSAFLDMRRCKNLVS